MRVGVSETNQKDCGIYAKPQGSKQLISFSHESKNKPALTPGAGLVKNN
jgi:hypothetical protein